MSSQRAPGWQKRVDRQKEHANQNLTSWFLKTFSSGKKTQYLREQDEAAALADRQRRPAGASPTQGLGQLSAVANATQQHGAGGYRADNERRTPQRQRSFLRQQLMEMKRQSAETLLRAQQQRIDGQITEEDLAALDAEQRFSDDEDDDDDDFDSDAETVHEVDEALGNLRLSSIESPDPAASTSSMASSTQVRSRRSSSAASNNSSTTKKRSKKLSRRSDSARSDDAKDSELADSELAEREQRAEYSLEVNRRLSQATQLYAEAINALDSALNPDEFYRRQPMPEPQPLLLGTKKASKNEWI